MPRVSVVIPAYNVASYIGEAINSVLQQTFKDLQIVVVNDGSTDDTAKAIAPFLDRIDYIQQPNRGLGAARNRGIEASTGELIALLDADDLWLPSRLETLVNWMDDHPGHGSVTSDAYIMREASPTKQTYYSTLPRRQRFRDRNQDYWIVHTNFVFVMAVIRKELFDRHGMFDETFSGSGCEDWNLWIRFLVGGERVGIVGSPLAYYRIRQGNLSTDRVRAQRLEVEALKGAAHLCGASAVQRGIEGRIEFMSAKISLAEGAYQEARRHFRLARNDRALDASTRAKAHVASRIPRTALSLYKRLRHERSLFTGGS